MVAVRPDPRIDPALRFKVMIGSPTYDDLQQAMLSTTSRYIVTKLSIRSDSAWSEVEMVRSDA